MTLVVANARGSEHVVMSCDSASFESYDDNLAEDSWDPVGDVSEPQKVIALTPHVLVGTIGCNSLGWDFKNRLGSLVSGTDRFDECAGSARKVVAELEREDPQLAGAIYTRTDGRKSKRASLHDKNMFSFLLAGFRRQDASGMLYGAGAEVTDVPEVDGSRIAITRPLGVKLEDVEPHFAIEDPSPAGAFAQCFATHHYLGQTYADRISKDVNVTMLVGDEEPLSLVLDRTDVEAAKTVYLSLQSGPELTGANRS